ncbi:MFS transporter (plasmid) [Haloferax mediterranei ATCC 33500]|uniref:MFS transporter n=1 Tax=Haloferax mediterranei (strain ATCC 33500 / DSM 1411 / JCM 8866 / NBRC 14739 / NCIMB 2177 / R-4) TaxID=523841 RepID=I3R9S0_HALMT|nr:MFS transporter [Haloferax mediterranei]AFK20980.1 major facilitator family oxalate/formate antiporter [Haloferax mediterranei ATCC 33500]AHZ24156.1 MFS transporter [Haloferax mediterranei ATCC 33500]EMA05233.1 major facilitator family oxalate/formate antiporter [Haloferax mediterranei ATCC 33500]MDX5989963.1 MFS transporter [Haloferax mediterranei ATCC 33500]QCQ77150.1 MFS transporter [Haloferax mediterranei ATCC 33500]
MQSGTNIRDDSTFLGPRVVAVTFLALMGAFGLNLSAGQFFEPLTGTYGWDLSLLSLAVSVNMITWGLFQPVMGRLIDWVGPKVVIAGSAALMGVAFLLSATISTVWEFFLYYGVLTAIGFAGCSSMANSVLVSKWYVRDRSEMLGKSSMGINIGQLIILPLAGYLIATAGFRAAFTGLGLFMLVLVVPAVLFVVEDDPTEVGQTPDGTDNASDREQSVLAAGSASVSLKQALFDRNFWLASLSFGSCGFTLYLVTIHLPNYAADLGGSVALGGQLLGIAAGASAVSMWVTGKMTEQVGKRRMLAGLHMIRGVSLAWLALSTSLWQLYVFAVIYGVASFPVIPTVTGIIGDHFGTNAMGGILGTSWLLHQIFAATGVFLGGFIRQTTGSYELAFWTGAALLLGGAFLSVLIESQPRVTHPTASTADD